MWTLGPLGFTLPWLLVALAALPILWLILRAVPPAPIRRRFPGVALLLGLRDETTEADRTPWWLLLIRLLAMAGLIIAFAGPLLNPPEARRGSGPLLILADGTWADARDWEIRSERIAGMLDEAQSLGRPVALRVLTDPAQEVPVFADAATAALDLPALRPNPWEPGTELPLPEGGFETFWLSDGLAREGRAEMLAALEARGPVTVFQTPRQQVVLLPPAFAEGGVTIAALRSPTGPEVSMQVAAIGRDPAGTERQLATATLDFPAGEGRAEALIDLPAELRNRVTRFEIPGQRSAAAVTLADDALRRREVALLSGGAEAEAADLLSPLHYLRQALAPSADLIEGALPDLLQANPDVVILADVAQLAEGEREDLLAWVEAGGLLVRFAGPRLAAADHPPGQDDPLLPVRLRAGGRSVGGAMSWGEPKTLDAFPETSPFHGLAVPEDVQVRAQVMAQPDPGLAERVIAQLTDGTPLVTRRAQGAGSIVLFHVTANAEWSSLPLSGLFVQMLDRLAISSRALGTQPAEMEGTVWVPEDLLDAFGELSAVDTMPGVPGEELTTGIPSASQPPGLYAGEDRRLALNIGREGMELAPMAWPASVRIEAMAAAPLVDLKGWILGAALILLMVDILASLALSGRLTGPRARGVAVLLLALLALPQGRVAAQDADAFAMEATSNVVLAHVLTGDAQVDETAAAGLMGLSNALFARTSIEPARPMGVNLETDELSFFPVLYWPVTADQPIPSRAAYDKLNRYLRSGGMILFDTRDADLGGFGSSTPEGRALQALARPLDIPPIEPLPTDHILTRTFYLLQEFPGRFASNDIWVESAPPEAEAAEGMPFRNLNDGVTPVVIGGNDWAAAWAVDEYGSPLYPVGRGISGERQREMALRFGINLVMNALTGNYKSDQVHVPALLDRLGQ